MEDQVRAASSAAREVGLELGDARLVAMPVTSRHRAKRFTQGQPR